MIATPRNSLWRLTDSLGKRWFDADRESVALAPDVGVESDVAEFRRHLAPWRSHIHAQLCPECVDYLSAAVSLYKGDFLAGFTLSDSANFDDWQDWEAANLRREFCAANAALADHHAGREEWEKAIGHAQRWLAVDPLDEAAHRVLMTCHARAGRRTEALRQYEDCVRLLHEELGAQPAPELVALAERIRCGELAPRPKPEPVTPPRHNLPRYTTSFVGREPELAQFAAHLADPTCRLLTLVGPGGCGKSRLAVQGAFSLVDPFADGVWFVPLVGLATADGVAPAIAEVIGFRFAGAEPPERQLLRHLQDKKLLLLLDNFEHLLEGVDLLTDLLAAAPDVKLVVTSRTRLDVSGEWLLPVPGLDAPPVGATEAPPCPLADYSAMALFLERSRHVHPSFSLETDTGLVAKLCRLLDGMPLAIELAAPWRRSLSLTDVVAQVERGLGLLSTSMRDVPERHRSMQAVFDHSWGLLTAQEQRIVCCLSVFRGGFTRPAAEAVTGAGRDEMSALVDQSWIQMAPTGRYAMHELARQYAAERLEAEGGKVHDEDMNAVRTRHARYFGAWLAELERQANQSGTRTMVAAVGVEIDNIRSGWQHAVTAAEANTVAQYRFCMERYLSSRGLLLELERSFAKAVGRFGARPNPTRNETADASPTTQELLICLMTHQATAALMQGRKQDALPMVDKSLALLSARQQPNSGRGILACAQTNLAYLLLTLDDYATADRLAQAALDVHIERERWVSAAHTLHHLAYIARNQGDYVRAEGYAHRGISIISRIDAQDPFRANLLGLAGAIAIARGRAEQAEELAHESLAIAQQSDDQLFLPGSYTGVANALMLQGQLEEAAGYFELALASGQRSGNLGGVLYGHVGLGRVALLQEDYAAAKEHFEQCVALSHRVRDSALALVGLGQVAVAQKNPTEAERWFGQALSTAHRAHLAPEVLMALAGLAEVYILNGDERPALPLLNAAATHPAATYETKNAAARRQATLGAELVAVDAIEQSLDDLVAQVLENLHR